MLTRQHHQPIEPSAEEIAADGLTYQGQPIHLMSRLELIKALNLIHRAYATVATARGLSMTSKKAA